MSTPQRDSHLTHVHVASHRAAIVAVIVVGSRGRVEKVRGRVGLGAVAVVVRRVAVAVWPPKGLPRVPSSLTADAVVTELHSLISVTVSSILPAKSAALAASASILAATTIITMVIALTRTSITSHQQTTATTIPMAIVTMKPLGRPVQTIATVAGHVNHDVMPSDVMSAWVSRRMPPRTVGVSGSGWSRRSEVGGQ